MKAIKISELKTNLSRYLKRVRKGERLLVMDRNEPIAEIIPLKPDPGSAFERMAREGRLKLGTQDRSKLKFVRARRKLPYLEALEADRSDSR